MLSAEQFRFLRTLWSSKQGLIFFFSFFFFEPDACCDSLTGSPFEPQKDMLRSLLQFVSAPGRSLKHSFMVFTFQHGNKKPIWSFITSLWSLRLLAGSKGCASFSLPVAWDQARDERWGGHSDLNQILPQDQKNDYLYIRYVDFKEVSSPISRWV